ncbi:MAG: hypothetical protein AAF191_21640 [Verrucomicrobiota bacterium]
MMTEIQEFALIQDFLGALDPQLELRSELSDTNRSLLTKIAEGEASDSDREQALSVLQSDSSALEFFAEQLKDN